MKFLIIYKNSTLSSSVESKILDTMYQISDAVTSDSVFYTCEI